MDPLRVAILTSPSAPGVEELMRDPNRGAVYEIAAVISREIAVEEIRELELDYLFVAGYEHTLSDALLEALPGRILELHGSGIRSTMTILTGPGQEAAFLQSQPFPVAAIWGPMLTRAIEFLAAGSVQIVHDVAWIDGAPGPCRLGAAPDVCHKAAGTIETTIPASCPFLKA